MAVYDRWHLTHPPEGAKKCSTHRKVPSGAHGQGLRFQVRGIDPDGQPFKRNFEYERDAQDKDAELRAAVRSGSFVDDQGGKATFMQFADRWRATQVHDHPSVEKVEQQLRIHCYPADGSKGTAPGGGPSIGQYSMAVLSRRVSLLRDWAAGLSAQPVPLAPNSARLVIGRVSSIFDAAVDDMIISRNPIKSGSFNKPKKTRTEVTAWPPETVEAACEALPERLRALGYLDAVTGARQGEVLGVALEDIDFLRRTVRYEVQVAYVGGRLCFKPLKNDVARTVPVAAPVIPVLSEHVRQFPPREVTLPWSEKGSRMDGKPVTRRLVFTMEDGRAYYRESVNHHWRAARAAAGMPDTRANGMHVLRHSAASRWLSAGLNPAKVAKYLGDTLAVVIATYSHCLPDDEDRGRAIMDGYVNPPGVSYGTQKRPENALAKLHGHVFAGRRAALSVVGELETP